MATRAVRWKIARRHLNRRRTHRLRWSLAAALAILLLLSGGGAAAGMYFASQLPPAGSIFATPSRTRASTTPPVTFCTPWRI